MVYRLNDKKLDWLVGILSISSQNGPQMEILMPSHTWKRIEEAITRNTDV